MAPSRSRKSPSSRSEPKAEKYPVLDGESDVVGDDLAGHPEGRNPTSLAARSRADQAVQDTDKAAADDIKRQAGDPDQFPDLKHAAQTQTGANTATATAGTIGHKPTPYQTASTGLNTGQRERAAGQDLDEANEGRDDYAKIGENEGVGPLSGARAEADPAQPT